MFIQVTIISMCEYISYLSYISMNSYLTLTVFKYNSIPKL